MIYTIGEALIDFVPHEKGVGLQDVVHFQKMGRDAFGDFLIDVFRKQGVNTSHIIRTEEAKTALAFVSLKQDGNRDFMFYRNPSADMLLTPEEINANWFDKGDILHFCSVDLIEAPVKYAHIKAINVIKEKNGVISFDPNIRISLWDDKDKCRQTVLDFIPKSHIIKVSDEELEFITGIKENGEAIASLFVGDVEIVIFTKGAQGAELYTKGYNISVRGLKTDVVDTTGAGDAFIGAFLYKLALDSLDINNLPQHKAAEALKFANAVAAISTTRKGAIESIPSMEEVCLLIEEYYK